MKVSRNAKSGFGTIYQGVGHATRVPKLKPGQVRCPCGKGVTVYNGRLRAHRTLKSQVPCVWAGTEVPS